MHGRGIYTWTDGVEYEVKSHNIELNLFIMSSYFNLWFHCLVMVCIEMCCSANFAVKRF